MSQDSIQNVVYVAGLNLLTREKELRQEVTKYGEIIKCELIYDAVTEESRGFAFVTMSTEAEAKEAIKQLNGFLFDGKIIRAEVARRPGPHVNKSEGRPTGGPVRRGPVLSPYDRPPLAFIPPPLAFDDAFSRPFYDPRIPPIISPLTRPFYDVPLLPHTQPFFRGSYPVPLLPAISGQREIRHLPPIHKDTDSYRPKIDTNRLSRSEKSYHSPVDHYKSEFISDHKSSYNSSYKPSYSPERKSYHGSDHKLSYGSSSDKYASDHKSSSHGSDHKSSSSHGSDHKSSHGSSHKPYATSDHRYAPITEQKSSYGTPEYKSSYNSPLSYSSDHKSNSKPMYVSDYKTDSRAPESRKPESHRSTEGRYKSESASNRSGQRPNDTDRYKSEDRYKQSHEKPNSYRY